MKEALAAYLLAVGLNLALVWQETGQPPAALAWRERPALTRLYDGARVAVTDGLADGSAYRIGLLVGERLYVSLADEHESLFPRTARWERLETSIAVLN